MTDNHDQCPNCGENLSGDGYTIPYHCINAWEVDWWYAEPDSGPWYCNLEDEEETNMKWFECRGEMVEVVYELIEAKNAQDAEKEFRAMYSGILNVSIKEKEMPHWWL